MWNDKPDGYPIPGRNPMSTDMDMNVYPWVWVCVQISTRGLFTDGRIITRTRSIASKQQCQNNKSEPVHTKCNVTPKYVWEIERERGHWIKKNVKANHSLLVLSAQARLVHKICNICGFFITKNQVKTVFLVTQPICNQICVQQPTEWLEWAVGFLDDGRCAITVAHAKLIMFGALGTVATVAHVKLITPMHGIKLMDLLCANVQQYPGRTKSRRLRRLKQELRYFQLWPTIAQKTAYEW
jgi:hypothetical protein